MSIKEAQRKRLVAEEERLAEKKRQREREVQITEEKRLAEEKRINELGPNFPKVWDLSYVREVPQKLFRKKRDDRLDWDFFKFKIYVNEKDYFTTNFLRT